ncbi:hypothetical protein BYT27DRAFT_6508015 [Phlegmacium glaucopus]|nr:hypothetical protein BYT27DRAFT_6508015 [Phlegmacium glaucopus]
MTRHASLPIRLPKMVSERMENFLGGRKAQKRAWRKNIWGKHGAAVDVDIEVADKDDESRDDDAAAPSILLDPRFAQVFKNLEFEIDETSREFALLNVSQANRDKAVVGEGGEESDKIA